MDHGHQRLDGGGLAGAVGPQVAEDLASPNLQVEVKEPSARAVSMLRLAVLIALVMVAMVYRPTLRLLQLLPWTLEEAQRSMWGAPAGYLS
jgi:hypothetical protein